MQVPYEIKPAKWGNGIFAKEVLPAGTRVWSVSKANIKIFETEEEAKKLFERSTNEEIKDLLFYCYWSDGRLMDLTRDDGRFFNHTHSSLQNCGLGSILKKMLAKKNGKKRKAEVKDAQNQVIEDHDCYTLRDIKAGEELFDDYNTFGADPDWYSDLLLKHGVDHSYMDHPPPAPEETDTNSQPSSSNSTRSSGRLRAKPATSTATTATANESKKRTTASAGPKRKAKKPKV
eukprot:gb/GEZN01013257.1/.p1 GENE.gb/GEZN01013257.1/~~gb/GEZN01013257.1/.p1  ORF type:complete len:232 (+),score=46.58 gb/GEZN01013257.1/:23-718(+)